MVHFRSMGERTTDITTARMAALKVVWSRMPSARADVAVMKANSPHADMANPTLKIVRIHAVRIHAVRIHVVRVVRIHAVRIHAVRVHVVRVVRIHAVGYM